jgi:hypothetical protein
MSKADTALSVAILIYATIVSVWYSILGSISHDEHQFMASAFMIARHGLHPYQDFAYFHMPNLAYLYAPFFFTSYPFLMARLFVGICAAGICLTLFLIARTLFAEHDKLSRLIIPIASTALLIHSPLFHLASSCVWNHTPSTLCAVLSFLFHCRALRGKRPLPYFFVSGVSLGMAIGIRLSFAPLILPFFFSMMILRVGALRKKWMHMFVFTIGILLANLPAVFFFVSNYSDFVFGNLGYAKLNTLYRKEMEYTTAMTFIEKVRYLKDSVFAKPGELPIVVVTLYSLVVFGITKMRTHAPTRSEIVFLLLLLPFVYLGCMAPTPTWHQYYFSSIPFLILLSLYTLSHLRYSAFSEAAALLLAVMALLSFVYSSPFLSRSMVYRLMRPASWTPIRVHQEAEKLRSYVDSRSGDGAVLTLSPLWAIESGLPIYKEFVTGPFAYRVSHLLSAKEAAERGLPLRSGVKSFIEEKHPRAILTGQEREKQLEIPFISGADEFGYQQIVTPRGFVLWLAPE